MLKKSNRIIMIAIWSLTLLRFNRDHCYRRLRRINFYIIIEGFVCEGSPARLHIKLMLIESCHRIKMAERKTTLQRSGSDEEKDHPQHNHDNS